MKVITPGHRYSMDKFEEDSTKHILQFIHKEKDGEDLTTLTNGVTNEEVLEVLINRMNYLQDKFPCRENEQAINKLDETLMWLNKRTTDRIKRGVEGKHIK